MSNSQQIFSKNLRLLLDKKQSSRSELARFTGVSTATVSDWINGKQFFRRETLDKICDYFCISAAQLLTEHAEAKPANYDEILLLQTFRQLNDVNKGASLQMMQGLLSAQISSAEAG